MGAFCRRTQLPVRTVRGSTLRAMNAPHKVLPTDAPVSPVRRSSFQVIMSELEQASPTTVVVSRQITSRLSSIKDYDQYLLGRKTETAIIADDPILAARRTISCEENGNPPSSP